MNKMVSRRELIGSVGAAIAMSGCFAPGGPTQRTLSLENVSIKKDEGVFQISARTYFSVRNLDPNDAFHDISIVGYTEGNEIVCRHSVELGSELSHKVIKEVTFTCTELPNYLTTAVEEDSCDSTFFSKHRITRSDSNITIEYVGDRRCVENITTIAE